MPPLPSRRAQEKASHQPVHQTPIQSSSRKQSGEKKDSSLAAENARLKEDIAKLRGQLQRHELDAQLKQSANPTEQKHTNGLSAVVEVAMLDANGAISMPQSTTNVMMEIGCSDRNTIDQSGQLVTNSNAFLISFEPLLDKVCARIA